MNVHDRSWMVTQEFQEWKQKHCILKKNKIEFLIMPEKLLENDFGSSEANLARYLALVIFSESVHILSRVNTIKQICLTKTYQDWPSRLGEKKILILFNLIILIWNIFFLLIFIHVHRLLKILISSIYSLHRFVRISIGNTIFLLRKNIFNI